jgi:hypothetical protein
MSQLTTSTNAFCYKVPPADRVYFSTLPLDVQDDTNLRLVWMQIIASAAKVNPACKKIAASLKQHQRGCSWSRIRKLYYTYTSGTDKYPAGDWRLLVNWAKVGTERRELPALFIEKVWRKLCEDNQRVTSEAWRELCQIWRTRFDTHGVEWRELPGYAAWPEADPETGLPKGWTLQNLSRYTPDKYELAAARIGIQAASNMGLKLRTSRVGLKLGEHVGFDDHEFDVKVNFPGQLQSWRPRCFGGVEDLSDAMPLLVIKPTFWDADEEKKKALNETDAMWFMVTFLTTRGYRLDTGSTFYVEHGTMAVRDWFEANITAVTNGKVKIARGGKFNKTAHGGQFAAPGGGNYRFKRLVEQYWRMINDRLASLPGQTGLNRDRNPEEMQRTDTYNAKLLKAARTMDVDRAAQLIFPRLAWNEFVSIAHEKIAAINNERDHKCQGWEKCGFLLKEWRASIGELDWRPQHLLAEQSGEIQTSVATNDLLYRVRRMTRAEAYARHANELTTVPVQCIPALVGKNHALRNGDPFTVRGGEFEFEDWRIDSDPIRFKALDATGRPLREGDKFIAFCNPMQPDALIICDDTLRVISVCPPVDMPAHNDEAGIKRAMGAKNSWTAAKLSAQRGRHEADANAIEFIKRHNASVLEGTATSQVEKKRVRNVKRFAGSAEVLAEVETSNTQHPTSNAEPSEDFSAEALS